MSRDISTGLSFASGRYKSYFLDKVESREIMFMPSIEVVRK